MHENNHKKGRRFETCATSSGEEAGIMENSMKLTTIEVDALKEAGNVGVGNAATAISKMLNKKIGINIPETKFVPLEKFSNEVGGAEKIVVSLYLQITGDLNGECIFLFPKQGAMELIDLLMMKEPGSTRIIEEMEESAFKEMSNIFVGAYISSIAKMLSMRLLPSVPHIATDMAQSIIDFMLSKLGKSADDLLCVKTAIDVEGHNINGQFIMIFEEESLKKIVETLHDMYGM